MLSLNKLFNPTTKFTLSKEEVANLLKTDVKALQEFEESYKKNVLDIQTPEDIFETNSRQASSMLKKDIEEDLEDVVERIVENLLSQTHRYSFKEGKVEISDCLCQTPKPDVTLDEIRKINPSMQPQLTGELMKKDIAQDSYPALLFFYKKLLEENGSKKNKAMMYHQFRQGLDILDLDPIVYEMIGTNPNSISHWFPELAEGVKKQTFFKVPDTTFIKVPLSLLQLTRQEYGMLTPTTIKIVDQFCMDAFGLDTEKDYFIKTGTYSSKFDFRNAYVHGEKEVTELGEYLLYIHYQALMMASPLNTPCIYGMSTTNEWVVREFIHDVEDNPCIYKGLPLHTEYRAFVDFDLGKVIGISPYWKPDVMKKRFGHMDDADSPHQRHDYVIYLAHEDILMERYNKNKDTVIAKMDELIPNINLHGQWSVDVMQNGNDFYIIDMAIAENSALVECVPKEMLKHAEENWIPELQKK